MVAKVKLLLSSFIFLIHCLLYAAETAEFGHSVVAAEPAVTLQSRLALVTPPQSWPQHRNLSRRESTAAEEVDILPPHYYRNIAPVIRGDPVHVKVSVVILSMTVSSGSDQTFDADIFYHNTWTDHRLRKPSNEAALQHLPSSSPSSSSPPVFKLPSSWRNRLWIPDTYFRNAISGTVSNILTPTHYFTVTNYTEVFMAVRLSLKLSCEMNFSKFPFDTQTCFINITSTTEDNSTVVLQWTMFRVGSHVDVTEFSVVSFRHAECTKRLDIGYFSCLYGEIVFKRNVGNYLIKRFVPSFIIVGMSMIGFWIPTQVSPTRTILPITALLALITQQIQSNLNVSYVYALQVWNITCCIFVFANLLEYAIALYVMHMAQKRKAVKSAVNDAHPGNQSMTLWRRVCRHFRTTSRSSSVDLVSRWLFPLTYGLFIFFFIVYCVRE